MDKVKQYLYYILIGVISFISLTFLPMLGTTVGMAWVLPTTAVGWIVWIGTKMIVSVLNMLIFYCFMEQGKLNIKDDSKYREALMILELEKGNKENEPRGPRTWAKQQYSRKGVSVLIGSLFGTFALTQAILTYDFVALLTYFFVISLGIIFGIIQMKTAEVYRTEEFWRYAKKIKKEQDIVLPQEVTIQQEETIIPQEEIINDQSN